MKALFIVFILLSACLHNSVKAQPRDSTRLAFVKKMYEEYALKNNIPGLAYGVVMNGRLVYSGGIGLSDVGNNIKVSTRSDFRITSMSKSFTALAILKLRDEGKLDLDDPVKKYLPGIVQTKMPAEDAPPITIRHLLTHTGKSAYRYLPTLN